MKCKNCKWEGEEGNGPLNHCPVCGDDTNATNYYKPEILIPSAIKEEPVKETDKIAERLKDIEEDLRDDGKLNYSNNPKKKSPGRKPKKRSLFSRKVK